MLCITPAMATKEKLKKPQNKTKPHTLPCEFYVEIEVNYIMVP